MFSRSAADLEQCGLLGCFLAQLLILSSVDCLHVFSLLFRFPKLEFSHGKFVGSCCPQERQMLWTRLNSPQHSVVRNVRKGKAGHARKG